MGGSAAAEAGPEPDRARDDAESVFDEPTIGLHPLDLKVMIRVLQHLIDCAASVIVVEHNLDMITDVDYVVDTGPGGGEAGGRFVAACIPEPECG